MANDLTIDASLLQTLRRILQQQSDIQSQIDRGPRMINQARKVEQQAEEAVEEQQGLLKKLRLAANEKQRLLDEREARIENLAAKRNACESNKEYQLLNEQISADEAANAVLSDEILELLEKSDTQEECVEKAQQRRSETAANTEKVKGEVENRDRRLRADLAVVEEELSKNESRLPGKIMIDYRRLVKAHAENALAAIDDNCCGNCYTKLSPQTIDQLRLQRVVNCSSCGSFLFMPRSGAAVG